MILPILTRRGISWGKSNKIGAFHRKQLRKVLNTYHSKHKKYKTVFNNSECTVEQNYGRKTRKVVRTRIAAK